MASKNIKKSKFSDDLAKKFKDNKDYDFESFFDNHIKVNKDNLTVVLKSHLYTEHLLDLIIKSAFVKPDEILKLRYYAKVQVVQSLGYISDNLVKKIKSLNTIRNKYAHNIDYEITDEDVKDLMGDLSLKELFNLDIQLRLGIIQVVGWLSSMAAVYHVLPFFMQTAASKNLFKDDPTFDKSIIDKHKADVDEFLNQQIVRMELKKRDLQKYRN